MTGAMIEFQFSEEWDNLTKVAIFENRVTKKDVILTENVIEIPWEVLTDAHKRLSVSVYGRNGSTVVIPTVRAELGVVFPTSTPVAANTRPTPELWEQALDLAQDARDAKSYASEALQISTELESRANAGEFKGDPGEQGPRGFTPRISAVETDDGYSVTIETPTDEGAYTVESLDIRHGEKGDKGDKGDTGPVYTLTAEDKAEIVKDVLDDLPEGGGGTGTPGKDGVSATHSWDGTVLTITSASGTSSADLRGPKGDKGDPGAAGPAGPQGPTGPAGPAYELTEADKQEIVEDVLAELPTGGGGGGSRVGSLLADVTLEEAASLTITDFDTTLSKYFVSAQVPLSDAGLNTNFRMFGATEGDYYLNTGTGTGSICIVISYEIVAEGVFDIHRGLYYKSTDGNGEIPPGLTSYGAGSAVWDRHVMAKFTDRSAGFKTSATLPAGTRVAIWGC